MMINFLQEVKKYELLSDEYELRLTVKPGITGGALPDNTAVVVLDTNVTPELVREGLVNDALRFIQDTRKIMNLDVSDRIHLTVTGDAEMLAAIAEHTAHIKEDVLVADGAEIEFSDSKLEYNTEIENHKFGIKIRKI
jgi:isoleucyl-tRNA synthetase